MICGENYHALQLLAYTHAGKVDVIYIDPPYNTGDKSWKYNNRFVDRNDSYRHSKWLAMMERRLKLAKKLLKTDGVLIVTIDEHEIFHLGVLLEMLFKDSVHQLITIVNQPKAFYKREFSPVNEYAIFVLPSAGVSDDPISHQPVDFLRDRDLGPEDVQSIWVNFLRGGRTSRPSARPNLCYPILVGDDGRIAGTGDSLGRRIRSGEIRETDIDAWRPPKDVNDQRCLWPYARDGSLRGWRTGASRLRELTRQGHARITSFDSATGRGVIMILSDKARELLASGDMSVIGEDADGSLILQSSSVERKNPTSVWHRTAHDAGSYGAKVLSVFLGAENQFDYPKSIYSTADALRTVISENPRAVVLDFFSGSGTTLHSVAMLNAQDGGRRQCILVTNNDLGDAEAKKLNRAGLFFGDSAFEEHGIFEAVTMPRVKAAITGTRPDGQPVKGSYLASYLSDRAYADGFEENVAFFKMEYLEPDLVELGRQYEAIAPLLWVTAGSVGHWEPWDGGSAWSVPTSSTYAVLFGEARAADFVAYVASRAEAATDSSPSISHVWIVTDSDSAVVELRASLPDDVVVGQLYRDYMRNFAINGPKADG